MQAAEIDQKRKPARKALARVSGTAAESICVPGDGTGTGANFTYGTPAPPERERERS